MIPETVFEQATYVELNLGDINYFPPGYGHTVYSPFPTLIISTDMINLFTYTNQKEINDYNHRTIVRRPPFCIQNNGLR